MTAQDIDTQNCQVGDSAQLSPGLAVIVILRSSHVKVSSHSEASAGHGVFVCRQDGPDTIFPDRDIQRGRGNGGLGFPSLLGVAYPCTFLPSTVQHPPGLSHSLEACLGAMCGL